MEECTVLVVEGESHESSFQPGMKDGALPSTSFSQLPGADVENSEKETNLLMSASTKSGDSSNILRHRAAKQARPDEMEDGFVCLDFDNEVEARKMEQNYMFGFKKWKGHVTKRPLGERSEIIQKLYEEPQKVKPFVHSSLSVGNVLYAVLIGWWLSLVYLLVGLLMLITIIGRHHAQFCFLLAGYFLWPFGKFLKEKTYYELEDSIAGDPPDETSLLSRDIAANGSHTYQRPSLAGSSNSLPVYVKKKRTNEYWDSAVNDSDPSREAVDSQLTKYRNRLPSNYWRRPSTYIWLILGCPLLFIVHVLVIIMTWLAVVFIPVAKLNMIAIRRVLLLPPERLRIHNTSDFKSKRSTHSLEVIMCSYQGVNLYYYKYTVDGMNVILVNMLIFVAFTIVLGYADVNDVVAVPIAKFIMGLVAIIPLAYYIGMGIASISAQSSNAIGAVLNATFGSIVELILYVSLMLKMRYDSDTCYNTLVKSALVGTLLATMLFIPGLSMVVGGIKHSVQHFNLKSASVSSTLLFISIAGTFSPTIYNTVYGLFSCQNCAPSFHNNTDGILERGTVCSSCTRTFDPTSDMYLYKIRPLIYVCVSLQLLAYIIGLVFTLKTHAHILEEQLHVPEGSEDHTIMQWGRIKSVVILLFAVVLMSLCAEVVVQNLEPVLNTVGLPDMFFGVTVLAIVPDIPEMVNGVQFAMKNNVNLSIEIGSSVAVQVVLLQIPILVLVDAVYPIHFYLIFSDMHMWAVIISAVIMNYILIDGKSNYFQGAMLCIVYLMLLSMYLFTIDDNYSGCIPG